MTLELWSEVDRYINGLFVGPDAALEGALEASRAAGLPAINVAPNQGKFLFLLATLQKAKSILEIGTLGGYSSIWLARALPEDGRLTTLELDPHHAEVARANIERARLSERVEVRVGPALETLSLLSAEKRGPFDFIFIDADKANLGPYFERALTLSRRGTVIVIDNVVRRGEVVDPESKDINVQGVRRLNELLSREKRVTVTEIQTVGSKGHDGFALVLVTGDAPSPLPAL
jgi:predicted O-methyltransferase YrrM